MPIIVPMSVFNPTPSSAYNRRTGENNSGETNERQPKVNVSKQVTSVDILEEIKRTLVAEPKRDSDCIDLWSVEQLRMWNYYQYDSTKDKYINQIDSYLKAKYGNGVFILALSEFNYEKNEMKISFHHNDEWNDVIFSKYKGHIYVKESESDFALEYSELLDKILSDFYDFYISYSCFCMQRSYHIKSVNSNFLINISRYSVEMCLWNSFELRLTSSNYAPKYFCDSIEVLNAITGKEEEILKKVFVKIKDCPVWMQPILREKRQKQLEELQSGETEKQKRMEFINRFFPFIENNV